MAKIPPLETHLAEAARRNKLVWLVFTAPWNAEASLWTKEVFGSPEVQALARECVTVEIPCDARPEWDQSAQFLMQSMAARSGWPLSLFLSPEGVALMGASSLTLDSLCALLRQLQVAWSLNPQALREQGKIQSEAVRAQDPLRWEAMTLSASETDEWLHEKTLAALLAPLEQSLDFESGMVGKGTSFQFPSVYKALRASTELSKWAELSLTGLSKSHICDVLGGGFFRAAGATSEKPVATEKLLVENAELLEALVDCLPAKSEFLVQVASETAKLLMENFRMNDGFSSSLSASSSYYRISPADLLTALPGRERQPAQMFFGIDSANEVPSLATDIPMLSAFLKLPPVDLLHELTDAKKRLLELRRRREEAEPVRGPCYRVSESSALRALLKASRKETAILGDAQVQSLLPILQDWMKNPNFEEGPRARWGTVRAWLAGAAYARSKNDRAAFQKYLGAADEQLHAGFDDASICVETPYAGRRWDLADHLGMSAGALRLNAIVDRLEIAAAEGDRKGIEFFTHSLRPLLAQALKICRPLGLHSAGVYEARMRFQTVLTRFLYH